MSQEFFTDSTNIGFGYVKSFKKIVEIIDMNCIHFLKMISIIPMI